MSNQTVEVYNQKAVEWTEAHNDANFWGMYMDIFHRLLPSGKVLEIGAGGGRDAEELIELGYEYLGTEPSVGMLNVAQARNSSAMFENVTAQEIKHEGEFDGFWASASLLHIPKAEIDLALKRINIALKQDGIGFIAIKKHVDDGPDERVEEDSRFFAYWQEPEFREVLKRNGFDVVEFHERPMTKTHWLIFIVKKTFEA